jgi:4-amino-4-deoxy-L-arabinose transferase-like glycosyltransferase
MAKANTNKLNTPKASIQNKSVVLKPGFIEKNALKIAILFAVLALVLRLYRLGFLSLWVDEYMHSLAAIKGQFKHGENNGILLTWLNTLFAYVLGHNEFSMRFPVALLGAALVPATYVLGKQIANYKVGLMAAIFVCFSLYLIFWSRVDRPYGMVSTFYVPLILSFWMMLEVKSKQENAWSKFGINPRFLWLTLLALLLSMLSQLICFLFIFSAGFYGSFVAIEEWVTKKSNPLKLNAYNLLFYLNVLAVVFMLTPIGNKMMRPIIEIFLPGNMATLILPDLKAAIAAIDGDKFYNSFDVYTGVINNDFKGLKYLGWCGFVLAFIKNRKLAYLLVSSFVVPFLLMSFVFREPVHAKYLTYIYPIFLISASYSLYYIAFSLMKYLSKTFTENSKSYLSMCTIAFIVLIVGISKKKEIGEMLKTETHGNIVAKEISEIHYVNWKQPCLFIKDRMQKGDVIMATVQFAPRFYLGLDSVVWFRQMHFDAKTKDYISNIPDKRKLSANTYEQLVKTFNENKRGWLLADYYFDNALTDPRAKQFVEQNFEFHFSACEDGAVKVFSWDKAKPKSYESSFVVELGKNPNQMGSMPMSININKATLPPMVNLVLNTEGIDSDVEAFILINDQQVAIKPNAKPSVIGVNEFQVNSNLFKEGQNKIQFAYNGEEGNGDVIKGCVIYSLNIR